MGGGGWLDQVELKLTQSPAEAGVEVGTELGIITRPAEIFAHAL